MKQTSIAIAHTGMIGGTMDIIDPWAVELINHATQLGYDVIDITGHDLTREHMIDILKNFKPSALFNFSFGGRDCLIGADNQCTLTGGTASNLDVLSGTAVISYSSYTGGKLGSEMIKAGSPAVIGFSDNIVVVSDGGKGKPIVNPAEIISRVPALNTQDVFKVCLLPLAKMILDGWTAGAAVYETQRDLLISSEAFRGLELISVALYFNGKRLTQLGDPNWKLRR